MIKKNSGVLRFKTKESSNNEIYYFVGDYITFFGKRIFLKNGILVSPFFNPVKWKKINMFSLIPFNLEYTENFDLNERIYFFSRIKNRNWWVDSGEKLLELIWNDNLIKEHNIKIYTVLLKTKSTPIYVFGIKSDEFIHGIELNHEKVTPQTFRCRTDCVELCEPVMFFDDIIKIEKNIGKYNFISNLEPEIRKTINKELDKIIDEV